MLPVITMIITAMGITITRIVMIDTRVLIRLLHLASPMLPVGAYAYSQGLEAAIESGEVRDHATSSVWIADFMALCLGRFELPLLARMHEAWRAGDDCADWNDMFLAGRDTAEARAETLQMGFSLVKLLSDLDICGEADRARLRRVGEVSFPMAFAVAAAESGIGAEAALQAFTWSWLENQVAVAMKTIPIGQVAGQKLLLQLGAAIPDVVAAAMSLDEANLGNVAPGLALAGCRHETQYSRLFRS
jgi:urease accessory protein